MYQAQSVGRDNPSEGNVGTQSSYKTLNGVKPNTSHCSEAYVARLEIASLVFVGTRLKVAIERDAPSWALTRLPL
jgi:hypothetical protein